MSIHTTPLAAELIAAVKWLLVAACCLIVDGPSSTHFTTGCRLTANWDLPGSPPIYPSACAASCCRGDQMNKRDTVLALLALGAAPLGSFARQPSKVWRIGMLETTSVALNTANLNAFVKGMQEFGYVEGRNFVIEYRSADGHAERFPDLATEMVRGKVDLSRFSFSMCVKPRISSAHSKRP
jgi:hypothetical protein